MIGNTIGKVSRLIKEAYIAILTRDFNNNTLILMVYMLDFNNVSYLNHCDTFNRADAWYNNRGVSWKVNLNQSIIYPSFSCLMTIPY